LTPAELSARRPVWETLASFYLDTEHDDRDLAAMADVLARSPYSVAELHEIELWEVAPVVGANLLSVAGAWAGFDPEWLFAACEKRAERRSFALRVAATLGFRRLVRWASERYWARLDRMIPEARATSPGEPAT
jgi:hypothetical protein